MLFRKSHGDDALIIEVAVGDGGEAIQGARLQPGQGIAAMAAQENQAILADRPREHERYSHRCDELPTRLPGFLVVPLRHGSVRGALALAGRSDGQFGAEDRVVLASLALHAAVGIENSLYHDRFANFFTHSSEMLVSILESKDIFYPGHSKAVAIMADMITRRLGLNDDERRSIHFGALLHDIGKIRLDPAILKETSYPSEEARRHMQEHPALGAAMLKQVTMWEDILPIIHGHHERWDGKGYPLGKAGEEIPLGARIVAIAEAFDAMTRATPHGRKRSMEDALAEVERCAGTQFDPNIASLFVAEFREHGDQLKL
jgi:putative nucleotidyltransferase with HDIG domain